MDVITLAPSPMESLVSSPQHKLLQLEAKLTKIVFFQKFKSKNKCAICGMTLVQSNPAKSTVCNTCL
jgi:hypothetical protein